MLFWVWVVVLAMPPGRRQASLTHNVSKRRRNEAATQGTFQELSLTKAQSHPLRRLCTDPR